MAKPVPTGSCASLYLDTSRTEMLQLSWEHALTPCPWALLSLPHTSHTPTSEPSHLLFPLLKGLSLQAFPT